MFKELTSTFWDMATLSLNPARQQNLSDKLLFSMPQMREDTAVIFGATKATLIVAAEAVRMKHKKFVIVGGKPIGQENPMFAKFVKERMDTAGLKVGYGDYMPENLYAKYSLQTYFGIPESNIITFDDDTSTNFQQNMEVLKAHGYDAQPAMEAYSLAGTARRLIGTARKVWNNDDMVISAHNVFPHGFSPMNWSGNLVASAYILSEAQKIIARKGEIAPYEQKGFVVPVNMSLEQERVLGHLYHSPGTGPKAGL